MRRGKALSVRFAKAIDRSTDQLAEVIGDRAAFRVLLFGDAAEARVASVA